jgi:hypothetical protein
MGLHPIKKFLHHKENNYWNGETAYRMGENLPAVLATED